MEANYNSKCKQSTKTTSLKIFKHYKLKPSFSIIKYEKAKDKVGVGNKPPPQSFNNLFKFHLVCLIQFDQVWSNLIQFDPIWSSLIQFHPIRSSLCQVEPKWSNLIQFDPIWSNLNQFVQVWTNLNQFDQIWSNSFQFDQIGSIWSNSIKFDPNYST